jgi:putative transcriptional regulator
MLSSFNDSSSDDNGYFGGHLLVAMPQMLDSRFERAVIYLCVHTAEGAMGLMLNRIIPDLSFRHLLQQLEITADVPPTERPVHYGGPVEAGRGFVLHSLDYQQEHTIRIGDLAGLTATIDVLQDIVRGQGPARAFLALGYVGWAPGQLDQELQENGWLTVPADADLLFQKDLDKKWQKALAKIGVRPDALSGEVGHA